ncbi:MAG: urease accessory protein UreF, partial [Peptostreptococcaceae bacterium]|nr:urease accessory protein UreF [Peptostreptococcaceae bacterium]
MQNSIDKNLFMLFQINDSLFPIGAYSHSYGLETYIQKKLVTNEEEAFEYLKCNLKSNFLYSELLAINLAYEYADKGRLDKLIRLDNILNASKSPKEIRLAGQKLGSRFIKTLMSADINYKNKNFIDYVNLSKDNLPTHTVAYGVFSQSVGIEKERAIEGFLYSYTSSTITNCVKSIPLSQSQGQQLLCKCYDVFEDVIEKLDTLTIDDLCLSTPG